MPWIKYILKKRPFVDRNSKPIDIIGRRNRSTMDEFSGGGHDYPTLAPYTDRYEGDNDKGERILMTLVETAEKELIVKNPLEELKAIGLSEGATLNSDLTIKKEELPIDYLC